MTACPAGAASRRASPASASADASRPSRYSIRARANIACGGLPPSGDGVVASPRASSSRSRSAGGGRPGQPPPVGNRDRLDEALGIATTPSPLGGNPPQAMFARALMEYRLGRVGSAETLAAEARNLPAPAGHAVMCDLLLALARHNMGRPEDARAAFESAAAATDRWAAEPEPSDPFDALDWVVCQVLRREAERPR